MLKSLESGLLKIGCFLEKVPILGARGRNTRGYIGPIGDDIPSLIPIIVGLVLFFSAFAFALNEFNGRTQSFAADRDALIIANSLKGSNYISQYAPFDVACKSLRVRGLHYVAGVVQNSAWQNILASTSNDPTRLTDVAQNFFQINDDPAQTLKCTLGESEFTPELLQTRAYVVLTFPVALELPQAVVSATLVVVAWRI